MKLHLHKLLFLGCFCVGASAGAGVVPEGYPVGRYSSLWEHSPFTIASVQQEVVPAGFATKFALVGLAKIGSDNVVTLLNKESQERIVIGPGSNKQDLKLVSVEQSSDLTKTVVTIQKGTETGKVKFDPTLLSAQSAPGVPPPNPAMGQPGVPQGQPGAMPPPVPPLRVRRNLPIPSPYQAPPPPHP